MESHQSSMGGPVQWNHSIPDTLGTASSALIKGGVLISEVHLYTSLLLYVAGTMDGVLIKVDVLSSGVSLWRGSTVVSSYL